MRVGIDLDGCLYDFVLDYHKYLRARLGNLSVPTTSDAPHWDFYKDYGYTTDQFHAHLADGAGHGDIWWDGLVPLGARETLYGLQDAGHTVHIITDRGRYGHAGIVATGMWLTTRNIPFDSLSFSRDKSILHVDVMVEDSPLNLVDLQAAGIPTIRFEQSWNADVDADFSIEGWLDLPVVLEKVR